MFPLLIEIKNEGLDLFVEVHELVESLQCQHFFQKSCVLGVFLTGKEGLRKRITSFSLFSLV